MVHIIHFFAPRAREALFEQYGNKHFIIFRADFHVSFESEKGSAVKYDKLKTSFPEMVHYQSIHGKIFKTHVLDLLYRVTHEVGPKLPFSRKQKLCFSIKGLY